MLNYEKNEDLKRMFSNMVSTDARIKSLFLDIPDLDCFQFSVSSEYDDSNYSDQTTLLSINGHYVDYEGAYEDEEGFDGPEGDKEKSNLPIIRNEHQKRCIFDIVHDLGSYFGYDEHIINRDDYVSRKASRMDKNEMRYLKSYISKEKIEDEWFLKADPKWACYYAQDHGRFNKELEKEIFCKEGRMFYAHMYAQAIKKPLPSFIETYFTTKNLVDPSEEDDVWFKEYLRFKQTLKKEKVE